MSGSDACTEKLSGVPTFAISVEPAGGVGGESILGGSLTNIIVRGNVMVVPFLSVA
jgi:anti-sigma-K factor RskA